MRKLVVFVLLLLLVAQAENYVVVNSMDGRDVLSGIFYANAVNYTVKFMPYPGGNADLLAAKIGGGKDILLIESKEYAVSAFLQDAIRAQGSTIELYETENGLATNLDLALRSRADSFVIVDAAYADGALSVMSYAALHNAYVILATNENADEIKNIVENADEIIIYGYVHSSVRDALSDLNPTYIGKGEDRYDDNVEISEMLMEEYGVNSVIFTEGTYIEEGMVASKLPFVLSGRLVPQVTYDFVKDKVRKDELVTVYLIGGTEITGAIRDMRTRVEEELLDEGLNKTFGIWVRYAQAVPSAGSGVANLDSFPLPAYIPRLNLSEVVYNKATETLMVRVDNLGDGAAYFLTEVKIQVDGTDYKVFGDEETQLIEYGDISGLQYPLDLSEIEEGEITAVVVVKYGSGKNTLEEYEYYSGPITEVEYIDDSDVTAKSANYVESDSVMRVSFKNNKAETAYASSEIELIVDGEKVMIQGLETKNFEIPPNTIVNRDFYVELTGEDLAANKEVDVHLDYGARAGFLVNSAVFSLPLEYESFPWWLVILAVVLLVIAVIVYYFLTRSKKEKSPPKR